MSVVHSSFCFRSDTAQAAAIGVALDGAARQTDSRGVCGLACFLIILSLCPAPGSFVLAFVPVRRVRVCQCAAAIDILVHSAARHVDLHVLLHMAEVAAAIDGAFHLAGLHVDLCLAHVGLVAAAVDIAGNHYAGPCHTAAEKQHRRDEHRAKHPPAGLYIYIIMCIVHG